VIRFSQKKKRDTWALNTKGLALNNLDKHEDALTLYDISIEIEPNNTTALINKANTLAFLKEYKEAIDYYDKTQKADSSIKEISKIKSQLYEKLGMADEAFLAAQGVLNEDMEKIKNDAIQNKCSVFHQFCQYEYDELDAKNKNSSE